MVTTIYQLSLLVAVVTLSAAQNYNDMFMYNLLNPECTPINNARSRMGAMMAMHMDAPDVPTQHLDLPDMFRRMSMIASGCRCAYPARDMDRMMGMGMMGVAYYASRNCIFPGQMCRCRGMPNAKAQLARVAARASLNVRHPLQPATPIIGG